MLIGILSDTHDQLDRTRTAVDRFLTAGAHVLIHCGDLTTAEIVYECSKLPAYFVFGNCDVDRGSLRRAIGKIGGTCLDRGGLITLEGRRIAVTHGDSSAELRRLASLEPDYLLSGHTHRAIDQQKGPTRWINPGALHRAPEWTVALLDVARSHLTTLTIFNANVQH